MNKPESFMEMFQAVQMRSRDLAAVMDSFM